MNLQELKRRVVEIDNEINGLMEERRKINESIREFELIQNTEEFLNEINLLTGKNSQECWLSSDTKTTPIMDDFQHSGKVFLIFRQIYLVELKMGIRVSLVVRKAVDGISSLNDGLTMTDLKKSVGTMFGPGHFTEPSRYYSLMREVINAAAKAVAKGQLVAFEHPVRLGGQTYANQTGFGSEYRGEWLYSQGTLYGETTRFYIIGIICEGSL